MVDIIPEYQGKIRAVQAAAVGVASETSITLPARTRWRLKTILSTLVTGVNVGNREVSFEVVQDGLVVWKTSYANLQTASQTVAYRFGSGLGQNRALVTVFDEQPIPGDILVNNVAIIRTVTTGLAGSDQWGQMVALVEEWQEPIV
jgi:hypothetical protein